MFPFVLRFTLYTLASVSLYQLFLKISIFKFRYTCYSLQVCLGYEIVFSQGCTVSLSAIMNKMQRSGTVVFNGPPLIEKCIQELI